MYRTLYGAMSGAMGAESGAMSARERLHRNFESAKPWVDTEKRLPKCKDGRSAAARIEDSHAKTWAAMREDGQRLGAEEETLHRWRLEIEHRRSQKRIVA